MARKTLTRREVEVIEKVVGCKPEDSKIEKARKGIEAMKLAGFPQREIKKAEQMLADAIARGVK
jgi:hypothetical protein